MKTDLLITGVSQLVTAEGAQAKRGRAMSDVKIVRDAAMAVVDGRIAWVGFAGDWTGQAATIVDLGGVAVVPGLIDPHTHAVWARRMKRFWRRVVGFVARCGLLPLLR
jgi:imidazolonepropionase